MSEQKAPKQTRPPSLSEATSWRDQIHQNSELIMNGSQKPLNECSDGFLEYEEYNSSRLSEACHSSSCHDHGDSAHLEEATAYPHRDAYAIQNRDEALTEIGSGVNTSLEENLRRAIKHPREDDRGFIPINDFDEILTRESVRLELQSCLEKLSPEKDLETWISQVWDISECTDNDPKRKIATTRRKMFAVLVLLKVPEKIQLFINEGFWDKDLPFVRSVDQKWTSQANGHQCKARIVECLNNLKDWKNHEVDSFFNYQWLVLAPIFNMADEKVMFYHLHRSITLPFESEDSGVDNEDDDFLGGGYSDVTRVSIHPAHYNTGMSRQEKEVFAIKKLRSKNKKQFDSEVESLKRFSNGNHPHLIKLLATYRHGQDYHLIFPWAEGNLVDFWKRHPKPYRTYTCILWLAAQCRGIAEGLRMIHDGDFGDSSLSLNDVKKGRHGDIKPENILWFKNSTSTDTTETDVLKISDFGLTRWHRDISNNKKYANGLPVSPTYRAPENHLGHPVSQPWDIWTLACLYLLFLTWYLCGWEEGVDEFSKQRTAQSSSYIPEDNFFNLGQKGTGSEYGASLKDCVVAWINKLHTTEGCSLFIHEFLDLISDDMLRIRYDKRHNCGDILDRLDNMYKKCEVEKSYCFESAHDQPRKRRTNDSDRQDPWDTSIIKLPESISEQNDRIYGCEKGNDERGDEIGRIKADSYINSWEHNQNVWRRTDYDHSSPSASLEPNSQLTESPVSRYPAPCPSPVGSSLVVSRLKNTEFSRNQKQDIPEEDFEGCGVTPSNTGSINIVNASSHTTINGSESPVRTNPQDGSISFYPQTPKRMASSHDTEVEDDLGSGRSLQQNEVIQLHTPTILKPEDNRRDDEENFERWPNSKSKRLFKRLKHLFCF
ncbi:kinase-like protein [Annulohypoxylon truncatum]|uniref:kinase-like protein n=1 Tax=Annulohypoxylon truncatum TaxID=327061 RepID=UPI0020087B41|nr:kinase-like protein [Annulohypoxylon truncatum]KAI1214230.1 kinase-like protein [Annulohypoxylon truncatum]